MNAAVAAKAGLQRAASHNINGNARATGTTVTLGARGKKIISPPRNASAMSATPPSMISLRGGGSRATEARPIKTGATVTMPSASEANQ